MRLCFGGKKILTAACAACLALATSIAWSADDVATLTKALSAKEAPARAAAAGNLADLGAAAKPALPALTTALKDPDAAVRGHAAKALGAIGTPALSAGPMLQKQLGDMDPAARAYAALALGEIGDKDPAAVDALFGALLDKDPAVRRAARNALRSLKLPRETTLPKLVKVLKSAEPGVAASVIQTVAEGGEAAVPFLNDALKDKEASYWACLAIAEIGPKAKATVPGLIEVLKRDEVEVRMQALVALGQIGPDAKAAVPAIATVLEKEKYDAVRYAAVFALARIGVKDEKAIAALKKGGESKDAFLQMLSAWAVAKLQPDDKDAMDHAVKLLVAGIESKDEHQRRAAARALAELHAPAEVVGPALVKATKDSDPAVIANAIDALAALGPSIVPRIATRLKDKDLRLYAARILGRIGKDAKEAAPALIAALAESDQDPEFRREVQYALGKIGQDSAPATPELIKSLDSKDELVRNSAIYALGSIGSGAKAAAPALHKLVDSKDEFTHTAALWALVRVEPGDAKLAETAVPAFTKSLSAEQDFLRAESANSLGMLGSAAKSALPALKKVAQSDTSPAVREAATKAIAAISGGK